MPKEIIERQENRFPVPYATWLRKDLKNFAWDILTDSRTVQRGYFNQKVVEGLLEENSRHLDHSKEIFSLIVLELWHRAFVDDPQSLSADGIQDESCRLVC